MTIRTVFNWLVILVLLLIVPHESRFLRIDSDPADWYGEIRFESDSQSVVIAKNSGNKTVDLQLRAVQLFALKQPAGELRIRSRPEVTESPPLSLTVAIGGSRQNRLVVIDEEYHVIPRSLSLFTRADLKLAYLLCTALLGLFMLLGFILADYTPSTIFAKEDKL